MSRYTEDNFMEIYSQRGIAFFKEDELIELLKRLNTEELAFNHADFMIDAVLALSADNFATVLEQATLTENDYTVMLSSAGLNISKSEEGVRLLEEKLSSNKECLSSLDLSYEEAEKEYNHLDKELKKAEKEFQALDADHIDIGNDKTLNGNDCKRQRLLEEKFEEMIAKQAAIGELKKKLITANKTKEVIFREKKDLQCILIDINRDLKTANESLDAAKEAKSYVESIQFRVENPYREFKKLLDRYKANVVGYYLQPLGNILTIADKAGVAQKSFATDVARQLRKSFDSLYSRSNFSEVHALTCRLLELRKVIGSTDDISYMLDEVKRGFKGIVKGTFSVNEKIFCTLTAAKLLVLEYQDKFAADLSRPIFGLFANQSVESRQFISNLEDKLNSSISDEEKSTLVSDLINDFTSKGSGRLHDLMVEYQLIGDNSFLATDSFLRAPYGAI